MAFDIGLFKRQRYVQPSITSFGGTYITADYSTSTTYAVHVFTSSGAFTYPAYLTSSTARVFLVGGGGGGNAGGGNSQGGGGGAGGVLSSSTYSLSPGATYTVAIGSGGAIGVNGNYSTIRAPTDTTYSGSFNGTTDKLSLPTTANAFTFGTGDFTVEYWVRYNAISAVTFICGNATTNNGLIFGITGSGKLYMSTNGTGYTSTGLTLVTGQWYHIAFVRTSGVVKFYVNGALDFTITAAVDCTELNAAIGGNIAGAFLTSGYISNLRVVKGTALYTDGFIPPNKPLTAIASTSLLTLQDATFKDNSANNFTLTPVGSVTTTNTSTFIPPLGQTAYGGGSGAPGSVSSQAGYGGASGGGASVWNFNGTVLGGGNIVGQGNAGGGATGAGSNFASGGGGGAFTAGGQGNAGTNIGGAGGTGTFTTFFSTTIAITASIGQYITATNAVYFGGGGGGGGNTTINVGGWGGGGAAGWSAAAITGTTNSGGGGGSAGGTAAAGGSGVVVITYPIPASVSAVDTTPTDAYFTSTSLLLSNQASVTSLSVDYLVVAGGGGGGGGGNGNAGGGAGGLLTGNISTLTTYTALAISVGGGGAGSASGTTAGSNGGASTFGGIATVGGGGGGSSDSSAYNGATGGSGGGSGSTSVTIGTAGSGTAGQGNSGGIGASDGTWRSGGGGGGAATAGGAATSATGAGNGGTGTFTTLISTTTAIAFGIGQYVTATNAVYFAGGGGGGAYLKTAGTSGLGGGSAGVTSGSAANALTNSGGGGGGGANGSTGGTGGSGVVLLKIPDAYTAYFSSGVTAATTTATGYNIYAVTSGTGTVLFAPAPAVTSVLVDYLVVAGGGGGGANDAGGGGAGGLLTSTDYPLSTGFTYNVIVGAGGAGAVNNAQGTSGNDSVLSLVRSYGGGGGGSDSNNSATRIDTGKSGGSGGGGAGGSALTTPSSGGSGVAGQGNSGGAGGPNQASGYGGGGGGGAGGAGTATTSGANGNGGIGLQSSITGSAVYYAGGGGGGSRTTPGTGGTGGGGAGSLGGITSSGTANTGGGGGGSGNDFEGTWTGTGGTGGSGVVIVRHLTSVSQTITTTGSPTIATTGSYTVYKFTSSGSILFGTAQTALATTNTSFIDSSANALTVTPTGTPTQGTFTPFSNNWSNYFNGSTDYLTIPYKSAFDFPASTPLCFEGWVHTSSSNTFVMANRNWAFGSSGSTWSFSLSGGNNPAWGFGGTGSATYVVAQSAISGTLGQWNHYAFTRDASNVVRIFVNGVLGVSRTDSSGMTSASGAIYIGAASNTASYASGYMSNLRLVVGSAIYTANFTPPTAPLPIVTNTSLLTCANNRFIDKNSTATITAVGTPSVTRWSPFAQGYAYNNIIQGGSAYFNSNSLTIANSNNLILSGNFTIEAWVYLTAQNTYSNILSSATGSYSGNACAFQINNGTPNINVYPGQAGTTQALGPAVTLNQWTHVAATRSGTTIRVFTNGVSGTPLTLATSFAFNDNSGSRIGGGNWDGTNSNLYGYISNLRVVKGTAIYTTAFTPPAAPVGKIDATTSTSLLLNFTNAAVYDATMQNDIYGSSTTGLTPAVAKFNGRSMYFNGTSDYLAIPYNPLYDWQKSAITIEMWIYPTAFASYKGIMAKSSYPATTTNDWELLLNSSGNVIFRYWTGSSQSLTSSGALTLNSWNHVAFTYNGSTTLTLYINGVSSGTATYVATAAATAATALQIGLSINGLGGASAYFFSGYIDDLRISKVARYTANFIPPTTVPKLK